MTAAATRFPHCGALPGGAYDLRPGPGGRAWDFDKPEDREEAEKRIDAERPYLLVGSPPCTDWCALNVRLNHPRMDPAVVAERRRRARAHLHFVVKLYLKQLARGAHFLHEHPASADSWDDDIMKGLLNRPEVSMVAGHMCRQGMTQVTGDGRVLPVHKATRWASSAPEVLARLRRRCTNEGLTPGKPGWHDHVPLIGKGPDGQSRTARAAVCPAKLCANVLRGMASQRIREGEVLPPRVRRALAEGRGLFSLEEERPEM